MVAFSEEELHSAHLASNDDMMHASDITSLGTNRQRRVIIPTAIKLLLVLLCMYVQCPHPDGSAGPAQTVNSANFPPYVVYESGQIP
ncbi:hypothetical protein M3J09_003462 [Ascochyta lentis]